MKKIFLMIIITGALIGYFLLYEKPAEKSVFTSSNTSNTLKPDPSNATFIVDEETITFSSGKNRKSVAPDSTFVEETVILDKFSYGDINGDEKNDTILFLARYGAGSGTFIYLAAFVSGPITYRGSEAIFLGDRVVPQSIDIKNGEITIKYLDRKEGEAMVTEPTVTILKRFILKSGKLVEK